MAQPWYELESDPGLFTLLVEDFGIKGVQVEEIYDLDNVTEMESETYGFIFLFRWIEERRRRRKLLNENSLMVKDQSKLQKMFFAHQMIPNSCATHALLSILLNTDEEKVELSPALMELKEKSKVMSAEQKGSEIASIPSIASAHNKHASPHLRQQQEKAGSSVPGASQTGEAYHYVSFLPIDGYLYEMDGLKPFPLNHGRVTNADWTKRFSDVITERLGPSNGGGDIMFNLMAVVPDKRIKWKRNLELLNENWLTIEKNLDQIITRWERSIPDAYLMPLVTNPALNTKEWMKLIKMEHNYCQPIESLPPSPVRSPVKIQVDNDSTMDPADLIIQKLSSIEDNESFEVHVHQIYPDRRVELQEISEFDPYTKAELSAVDEESFHPNAPSTFSIQELQEMLTDFKSHITDCEQQLQEQEGLRDKYKIDVCRRTHNYYPFITTFLRMLSEQGLLGNMVNQLTQAKRKLNGPPPPVPVVKKKKGNNNDKKEKSSSADKREKSNSNDKKEKTKKKR